MVHLEHWGPTERFLHALKEIFILMKMPVISIAFHFDFTLR